MRLLIYWTVPPSFASQDEEVENTVLYTYQKPDEIGFEIHNMGNGQWHVTGERVEKIVQMASLGSDDGIKRFAQRCVILVWMMLCV